MILEMQEKMSMTSNSENYTDMIIRPPLLTTSTGTLETNKTQILAHIQKFDDALRTVHDKMTKLEGDDKRTKKLDKDLQEAIFQKGTAEDNDTHSNNRVLALITELDDMKQRLVTITQQLNRQFDGSDTPLIQKVPDTNSPESVWRAYDVLYGIYEMMHATITRLTKEAQASEAALAMANTVAIKQKNIDLTEAVRLLEREKQQIETDNTAVLKTH